MGRGRDAQFFPRLCIPVLDQIPSAIQRALVIHQPNPEGRKGAKTPPRATIGTAHFDEFLHPRLGEERGQMIGPIAQRRLLAGQRRQLALQKIAEGLAKCVDIFAIAVDKIHRHIERILHPSLKPKTLVKDERHHPSAGIIQIAPHQPAGGFHAIGLAVEEG